MGLLRCVIIGALQFLFVACLITFIPGLPPYDVEFKEIRLSLPRELKGALVLNKKLDNAERLFENEIKGPETLIVHNGKLYMSVHGGYVIEMNEKLQLKPLLQTGNSCDGIHEEEICGRPLGITFHKDLLYIADAYYGIIMANITSGQKVTLVSLLTPIDGKVPQLPNSLVVSSDGSIFWTDSSTSHKLCDGVLSMLGTGNGRLIKYNPVKGTNEVLMRNLHFPNGVAISPDEDYLIIAESAMSRLHKFYLKGNRAGSSEIFIEEIPGMPDNLKSDGKGGVISPLVFPRDSDSFDMIYSLGPQPLIRKFLVRSLTFLELFFEEINKFYPTAVVKRIIHWIGHFESLPHSLGSNRTTVLFINSNGFISNSFHSTDGKISAISDIVEYNGYYYLGSPFNNYLARVKIISKK